VYLLAVIDESLRMCPPVSAAPWRVVQKGGQRIGSYDIPEGTEVGTSLYSLMHNPAYFDEPYRFNPDRWIESEKNPSEKIEIQRRVFAPFLIGARMCAARNMAMAELWLTIATVMHAMDFKPADGPEGKLGQGKLGMGVGRERPEEFQLLCHFVTVAKKGPVLQFRRRDSCADEAETE
jgi:cytochrome P450